MAYARWLAINLPFPPFIKTLKTYFKPITDFCKRILRWRPLLLAASRGVIDLTPSFACNKFSIIFAAPAYVRSMVSKIPPRVLCVEDVDNTGFTTVEALQGVVFDASEAPDTALAFPTAFLGEPYRLTKIVRPLQVPASSNSHPSQ